MRGVASEQADQKVILAELIRKSEKTEIPTPGRPGEHLGTGLSSQAAFRREF